MRTRASVEVFCGLLAAGLYLAPATRADAQPVPEAVLSLGDVDEMVVAAGSAEREERWQDAANHWLVASSFDAELADFARFRAFAALSRLAQPPLERLGKLAVGGEGWGFAGAAVARLRVELARSGNLRVADVRAALDSADHDDVCLLLDEHLSARSAEGLPVEAGLVLAHHGRCSDEATSSYAEKFGVAPDTLARIERAERLYGRVRFTAALEELDKLSLDGAPADLRCRAQFRRARTLYRLRARRAEAEPLYRQIAAECTGEHGKSERKSALYAWGKRRFELGDAAGAKAPFDLLLADYSDTTHADDALFWLARVARANGDRPGELALLARAISEHSDGDMVFETAWEVWEGAYRKGDYAEFVAAIDALALPGHDNNYFSQGRLEYFAGQALRRLGRDEEALARWSTAWVKYPFSFYGYLSRMRLAEAGGAPAPLSADAASLPPWLRTPAWTASGAGRLAKLGFPELGVSFASGQRRSQADAQWRYALVHHEARRFEVSHNVVRRGIEGRPWGEPAQARAVQWDIAWPRPYESQIRAAVKAELEQNKGGNVRPALPAAIMREESSFIEDIESYAGALGLMQLMPRTALGHDDDIEGDATVERLKSADVNIRVGVDHLFWLARRWDSQPVFMVAAYNAGSGALSRWLKKYPNDDVALFIEDIPSLQTRDYTKRVIGSYAAYQFLGGSDLDASVLRVPSK